MTSTVENYAVAGGPAEPVYIVNAAAPGGGGGAVTAADGSIVAVGATTDAAASPTVVEDTTPKSGISLWKGIKNLIKLMNDKLVAGTIIGDVNVRAITAGETHLGEIGGKLSTVSVEFTRENNATPYSIGDVISSSAGSPVVLEIPNIMRVAGGSGYVTMLRVVFNVKSVTPTLRVHFYNASNPTISGDNLLHQEKYADVGKRLGFVDLPAMITGADATNSDMSRAVATIPVAFPLTAAGGSRSIWVELETLTAVILTAQSKVTVVMTVDNN